MDGIDELRSWIGRTETMTDQLTRQTALRTAALLDQPLDGLVDGAAVPQGWYALLFGPLTPQSEIGRDGHAKLGQFLPPVKLPRRMFAGRRVVFHAPLRIGDEAQRVSEIAKIEPKDGRSGRMIFVSVEHRVTVANKPIVTETQNIVYREAAKPGAGGGAAAAQPAAGQAAWTRTVVPDAVMVFRYSALTYNGHRIHYDADYTKTVEGYPERVVNGGLTTLLAVELGRAKFGRPLKTLETRNLKPLFVDKPITLCGRADGDAGALWVLDADGALALSATAELA